MSVVDFGDTYLLDQAEFEDDFFVANAANKKDIELSFSISSHTNLTFQSLSLLPTFPPPKYS